MGTLRTHTAYGGDTVLPAVAHELLAATSIALHLVPFLVRSPDAVYPTSPLPNGTSLLPTSIRITTRYRLPSRHEASHLVGPAP